MFSDGYLGLSLRAGSSYRASDLVLWPRTAVLAIAAIASGTMR